MKWTNCSLNFFEKHNLPIWTHGEIENLYSSKFIKGIVIKCHVIKTSSSTQDFAGEF